MYDVYAKHLGFKLDYSYVTYILGSLFVVLACFAGETRGVIALLVPAWLLHVTAVSTQRKRNCPLIFFSFFAPGEATMISCLYLLHFYLM